MKPEEEIERLMAQLALYNRNCGGAEDLSHGCCECVAKLYKEACDKVQMWEAFFKTKKILDPSSNEDIS